MIENTSKAIIPITKKRKTKKTSSLAKLAII